MTSLVLRLEKKTTGSEVERLCARGADDGCSCFSACSSLCKLVEMGNIADALGELVVLSETSGDLVLGRSIVVTFSNQSRDLVERLVLDEMTFECFVTNMEGVLDEGLVLGEDFSLQSARSRSDIGGMDRMFLASQNWQEGGYWCFVLNVSRNSVGHLLESSTVGYLMGVRAIRKGGEIFVRLVRRAGYLDGDTDLVVSNAGILEGGGNFSVCKKHAG